MSFSRLRVRYAETDQMKVAYYGNYFTWFEVARVDLLRAMGVSYRSLEQEHNRMLPVVDAHCRYRMPAVYDDELEIEARPLLLRGAVIRFGYTVRRVADGVLLAEGDTTHVVCDTGMVRSKLPAHIEQLLRQAMAEEPVEPLPGTETMEPSSIG